MAGPRPAVFGAAMHFAQTAYAHRFAQVDVARHRGGAGVEPVEEGVSAGGGEGGGREDGYQSIDWGGSSLEGEVLTVSTQPGGKGELG